MRRTAAAAVLLLLPLFGHAAEPGKFATLSPKEIADGWILLFDGQTKFGWTSPNGSKWTILDGMLAPQAGKPGLLVTTTAFVSYLFTVEYRVKDENSLRIIANTDAKGKDGRSWSVSRPLRSDAVIEGKGQGAVSAAKINVRPGKGWWKATVRVESGHVVGVGFEAVGGGEGSKEARPVRAQNERRTGYIALSGSGFIVRSIKLKPLSTWPLFDGKDLTGWKKYEGDKKRAKSTFSVTKEGWLSLKNGPGDLQTQGQWADFVLQLDCRTNGKYLNSGVFFRCLPGQYQMGYEAQIHNKFLDPPGKEYTLNVYDPQTHKPTDKKKELFLAADYGTGAIYRRMPARLQRAKDNEWLTMTVAAHGRHLATWVNGLQVVDWTDNRPLAANAREGCYLKKGPISLQGHDPTTDLNFRNLRLAELPPPPAKQ